MPRLPNPELDALMLDTAPRVPPTPPVGEDESPTLTIVRQISAMRDERNKAYRRRLKEVATKFLAEKRAREEAQRALRVANRDSDNLRLQLASAERTIQNLESAARAAADRASSTPVNDQLRLLHETAIIWRDASNGTSAKLNAFRNFCAVLDSLPAAEQTPAPQEAPQPF